MNPVEDPLVLYCQPVEDVLPHPMSSLVTGITPQQAKDKGVPEPAFFQQLEQVFARPNSCGAGYNSIRFDDEFTRYGFYRNFIDPYGREWRNGNSRWDLIDVVRLVYALRPRLLNWPLRSPGVPSFRLELLSQVNGILHEDAHDALSDVRATIELARLIRAGEPGLYDYCWQLRDKHYALSRINLADHRPLLHISSRYPASQGCLAVVAPLLRLRSNPNAIVVFDLHCDPEQLGALNADEMEHRVFSAAGALAEEGAERLPIKLLHLNRTPMIAPVAMLTPERAVELGIELPRCEAHWQRLPDIRALSQRLEGLFAGPERAPEDPEQALYQGFINDADRALCERVRQADDSLLRSETFPFQDRRLSELLFRYRARFFPASLSSEDQLAWHEQVTTQLQRDDPDDYQCLRGYFALLDQLEQSGEAHHPDQQRILEDLRNWGLGLQRKYSQA